MAACSCLYFSRNEVAISGKKSPSLVVSNIMNNRHKTGNVNEKHQSVLDQYICQTKDICK